MNITLQMPGTQKAVSAPIDTPEQMLTAAGQIANSLNDRITGNRLLMKAQAVGATSLSEAKTRLAVQLSNLADSYMAEFHGAKEKAVLARAAHSVRKPGQSVEEAKKTRQKAELAEERLASIEHAGDLVSEALKVLSEVTDPAVYKEAVK